MPRKNTINDRDRTQWIENDEGLYNWWNASGQTKQLFLKCNRAGITEAITNIREERKSCHYLAYGQDCLK